MDKLILMNAQPLPEEVGKEEIVKGVQISPVGDFPHGETTMQHVSEESLNAIVDTWKSEGSPEILCDFEHGSERADGSTEAAAWISNLAVYPEKGLVGDFKFTDKGADAIKSRRYRFLSPVWETRVDSVDEVNGKKIPKDVTPIRFVRCALTNCPNIPVACVLNRAPTTINVEEPNKETKNMDPKKLAVALGLPETATEDEILAAVNGLVTRCGEMEKAKLEIEANACADQNKERVSNREEFVKAYIANKDATLALLKTLKPVTPTQTVLANAKTPTLGSEKNDVMEGLAKCRNAKERCEFVIANAKAFAENN